MQIVAFARELALLKRRSSLFFSEPFEFGTPLIFILSGHRDVSDGSGLEKLQRRHWKRLALDFPWSLILNEPLAKGSRNTILFAWRLNPFDRHRGAARLQLHDTARLELV
jgi:hypothetical protein